MDMVPVPYRFEMDAKELPPHVLQLVQGEMASKLAESTPDSAIVQAIVAQHGTTEFMTWLLAIVKQRGPDFTLDREGNLNHGIAVANYEAWARAKKQKQNGGVILALSGIICCASAGSVPGSLLIFVFGYAAQLVGVIWMLDSRNRSRWFVLLGLFAFFVRDHNHRTPPDGLETTR